MMKNIFNSIKEKISKHKKVSILVLLLFLLIGGSIGYVLVTNSATNSNPKVTQTNNQNKNPDTNATGSKDDKKNDDKKSDEKKTDTDTKPKATVAPSNDVAVEETKNTTSNNVSNNTSTTTNNTTSNSTSSNNTPAPCVPTYTTVNHPEQGHYETHVVQEAWDDPQFEERVVGIQSGHIYNSSSDFIENGDLYGDDNYTLRQVQVGSVHHDAVTTQVWVVDQAAWTETVASGC
jgi:hypothetical protein